MKKYDVIVLGGGFSGSAAALAASRQGKKVLIVEQAGYLGGAATNCLITPFMYYFTQEKVNGEWQQLDLSRGIFLEICQRLREIGGMNKDDPKDLTIHEEFLKIVLDRMMSENNVDVLFHSVLCDVEKCGEKITSVTVISKGLKQKLEADFFIDCSGDANLAVMSGCPYHIGRKEDNLCQPMTLCFRIVNIDMKLLKELDEYKKIQEVYLQWQKEGKTSNPREDVLIFKTLIDGCFHFNSTRIVKLNPVDAVDVSKAEMMARQQALELYTMLKENLESFKNADYMISAPSIGTRESRMIDGEHLLTVEELKDCTVFEDSIAVANYDIDIHNPEGTGTTHYWFPVGKYYTIPYRSLVPKNADNLLVAGRCISSTHEAQASIRIMPIVSTLGEAAGVAAAVALNENTTAKNANIKEIQRILAQNGAKIN